jgi:KaiC/GvpD/RAD55 family RecA-like ATPase
MPRASTQDFLEIDQIREGVVILKSRALRGVMLVSSLNFALKSQEEQSAIIYQFQNFLNSLDFSCQIVVQSRRINITNYLETLKYLEKKQKNELLKIQTASYRNFIEELVAGGTIMTKHFFLVVPYTHLEAGEIARAGKSLLTKRTLFTLTEKVFQRAKTQLWQRMEFVALGLRRCGLRAMPLSTPELIELFWQLHHPQEAEVGYYPEIPPELIK